MNLPFDLAQGGELVEPFRASCFGFRIFRDHAEKCLNNFDIRMLR